jgi:hypothetical protein
MPREVLYRRYTVYMTDEDLYDSLMDTLPSGKLETTTSQFSDGTNFPLTPHQASLLTDTIIGQADNSNTQRILTIDGDDQGATSIPSIYDAYAIISADHTVTASGLLLDCVGAAEAEIRWVGSLYLLPTSTTGKEKLKSRRFIQGFENATNGDSGNYSLYYSRDASRTAEGKGFALRSGVAAQRIAMTVNTTGLASSWERFYMRVRKLPAAEIQFWAMDGTVEAGNAAHMTINASGIITAYNMGNQAYPGTSLGTFGPVPLNEWLKIDLLIKYAVDLGGGILSAGEFDFFLNGTKQISGRPTSGGGLSIEALHQTSTLGNSTATANVMEIDFDDWINAEHITTLNNSFSSYDWLYGSHVELVRPTTYGSGHSANWVGDVRVLSANPVIGMLSTTTVVGSVASSRMEVETDYRDRYIGCPAFEVIWFPKVATAVTSQLGWSIYDPTTAAYVDTLTSRTIGDEVWEGVLYTVTTATSAVPPSLAPVATGTSTVKPLKLVYVKDGAAASQEVQALQAQAEFLGDFGPEDIHPQASDDRKAAVFPPRIGPHNSSYPRTGGGEAIANSSAPFLVMSGTYTGNDTGQDIQLAQIPHWWWVRPLSGADATNGVRWWSSMTAAHGALDKKYAANRMIRAQYTSALGAHIQVAGAGAQSNANGVVYQYIAVHDPAMRFMINGAFSHKATDSTHDNKLPDTRFTPEGVFSFYEDEANSANGIWYKGVGHTVATASPLSATQTTTALAVAQGVLTSKASFHSNGPQSAYSAWRSTDFDSVTGAVAITSYTGNATNPRTITLALGGKCPLFALVVPHNGASYFRDPSHTGTTSSLYNSGTLNAATAIIGGDVNSITVESVLNSNGVIYDVFALPSATTTPGSWGANPAALTPIVPVSTITNSGGPWFPGATDTGGWWKSIDGFVSESSLVTSPAHPEHPRAWNKIAAFSTIFGGSPGPAVVDNNCLIYAGDDYDLGIDQPTLRLFDGTLDKLLIKIPNTSAGVVPQAIMSMLLENGIIYLSTFDSGTSSADYSGRVFAYDILNQTLTPLGAAFASGEVPYALAWHLGRLWVGTNQGDAAASSIYFIRPGIDTSWTTDYTLTTSTVGGATSLISYKGALYVGTDNVAGSFAKLLVRAVAGTYSTSYTVVGGTAAANNSVLSMIEFKGNLLIQLL